MGHRSTKHDIEIPEIHRGEVVEDLKIAKLRNNVCPPIGNDQFDDLRMSFLAEMQKNFTITEDGFTRLMIDKFPHLGHERTQKIVPALYKVYDRGINSDF